MEYSDSILANATRKKASHTEAIIKTAAMPLGYSVSSVGESPCEGDDSASSFELEAVWGKLSVDAMAVKM